MAASCARRENAQAAGVFARVRGCSLLQQGGGTIAYNRWLWNSSRRAFLETAFALEIPLPASSGAHLAAAPGGPLADSRRALPVCRPDPARLQPNRSGLVACGRGRARVQSGRARRCLAGGPAVLAV